MTAPAAVLVYVGADSLKKPHHIATLLFSKGVNDHPKYVLLLHFYISQQCGQKILKKISKTFIFVYKIYLLKYSSSVQSINVAK